MAIDDQIDDETEEVKPKKKSNLLLIILSVTTILLLIIISVGATLFMTGAFSGDTANAAKSENEQTSEKKKSKKENKKKKKNAKKEKKKPLYVEMGDPLIVNFVENNQIRYLQVNMEVMTRDETMPEKIKEHMPLIRNNLLMMLSGLDYETISTFAGKQKIRDEALAEIQSILKEQTGEKGAEELYFTSFVMQ